MLDRALLLTALAAFTLPLAACSFGDDDDAAWGDDDDGTPPSDDDDGYPWGDDDDATDAPGDGDDDDSKPVSDDDDAAGDDDDSVVDDVEDPACTVSVESPVTLFVSADDSNSQADLPLARALLESGALPSTVRPYEVLNYYDFDLDSAPAGELTVTPQLRPRADDPALFDLLVAVTGPASSPESRAPLNLVFAIDTSCSMGGEGMAAARHAMSASAASLDVGDRVSIVRWSSTNTVALDGHAVTGPNDPVLVAEVDDLDTSGTTNLSAGLLRAYEIAAENSGGGRLNRVVLISDGGANTGTTDRNLIGAQAQLAERDRVYLVGIGTPPHASYNHELMDTVTDLGKGAYLYVDDAATAWAQLTGAALVRNFGLAAEDVRLEMTLPPGFVVDRFYGEEISTNPADVTPQNLGPNDSMLYLQEIRDCSPDEASGALALEFTATWVDVESGLPRSATVARTLDELQLDGARQLLKANALVAFATSFEEVWLLPSAERRAYLDGVTAQVQDALTAFPSDADLQEVLYLSTIHRDWF